MGPPRDRGRTATVPAWRPAPHPHGIDRCCPRPWSVRQGGRRARRGGQARWSPRARPRRHPSGPDRPGTRRSGTPPEAGRTRRRAGVSSTEAGPPPTVGGGRYTLGDLIGRGGAAEVFRARDELLGRDVAVKLFPAGVGEADESRRQREVQTLAGMNHPGLVTIYDVGQERDRAYFVMQLIEGESLADRIRSGPLALGDVVALGAALGDALTYVHRHGVVHRDIKPGNVLLDTEGRPHLSDFGIAVLADATNITATGMVIGTASYLSPEQVRGQQVGPASDVYALGLVLLECITARREYPGNALEAAVARLHRAPEIPPELPAPLAGLIAGMTRDEPTERPTTEQVVGELRMLAREV